MKLLRSWDDSGKQINIWKYFQGLKDFDFAYFLDCSVIYTHFSVPSTVKLQKLQLVLEQISSNSAIVGVGPVVFLLSLTAYYVTNELFSSILYLVNIQNWSTLLSCFFSDPVLLRVFWYVFCYSVYYCWTVELLNLHPL